MSVEYLDLADHVGTTTEVTGIDEDLTTKIASEQRPARRPAASAPV